MARPPGHPDPATAERLVAGRVDPADAPPGFRLVAGLLQDAATLPPGPEPADDEVAVGAMVAAIASARRPGLTAPVGPPPRRRRGALAKVLAAVTMATLATGGVAAAAGNLPDPVQDAVSAAVGAVGIEIPRGNAYGHLDPAEKDRAKDDQRTEQDDKHDAEHGASEPGGTDNQGHGQGQGSEMPAVAHDPDLTGTGKGACVSAVASDGKSNAAGQHDVQCAAAPAGDPAAAGETPGQEHTSGDPAPPGEGPAGGSVSEEHSGGHSQAGDDHGAPDPQPDQAKDKTKDRTKDKAEDGRP